MTRWANRACILFCSLLILTHAHAGGLSTSFVDVFVKDVPLGEPKRVENKDGQSLILWNTGETPLVVHVAALKPATSELRGSAEPIEDTAWVVIQPSSLTLGPHGQGQCNVVLSLPANRKLRHRLFQTMIWTRSEPVLGNGVTVSGGLKSRLRFQTAR